MLDAKNMNLEITATKPRRHQQQALDKLAGQTSKALFMEVGTGKTWVAIRMIAERYISGQSSFVLVVSKNGVQYQWVEEQIPMHISPDIPWKAVVYQDLVRVRKEIAELEKFDGLKIVAINVESVNSAELTLSRFLKASKKTASIIIDESHLIKSLQTKRTKASIRLARFCNDRMIMTGTPISEGVEDLWAQLKFLGEGIIGYTRKEDFLNDFCNTIMTPFGTEIIGYKNLDRLYELLDPFTFRITSEEALDLPPRNYVQAPFVITDEQRKAIRTIRDELEIQIGAQTASAETGGIAVLRAQQIASGFLPDDEGGLITFPNPRLEALLELLPQCPQKVIIWCRFHYDVMVVCKALGDRAMHYYGETEEDDRQLAKRMFMDPDSGVDYLVASAATAGTGLNLQGICYTNIYYTNSFNAIDRWQSEGRTWRDGTIHPVTYIDLMGRYSPDAYILKNLKDKKSVSDLTLDEYRKALQDV